MSGLKNCPHTGQPLIVSEFCDSFLYSEKTGVYYYKNARSLSYDDNYFSEEYKAQYGKTYIEDEKHLRHLAGIRLKRIKKYLNPHAFIFEIGCAAGFFLDEAKKRGYKTGGMEISAFASQHARELFNLNVICHSFADHPSGIIKRYITHPIDAIASFFTIEHFSDQKAVFQNISQLLKSGGILSLALPSIGGPLFRRNRKLWIDTHPEDHFADYSPDSLKKVLNLYGFRVLKIYPASYHPERIHPFLCRFPFSSAYKIYADLAKYGDTMEVLAVKTQDF
ncbi:MAG: class I SAM-dependent methyltransferase [Spirochaetia bacterium]|nr:class I SAM-dependent methyltransferase [Spirochaetia bacterium]